MNLQLEGKLALVTGSTAGIGFAIAKGLAAEGARVVVNGRTDARVATALKAIRRDHPGARLDGFVADLSRAEESLSAYERFPNLEILVNNLGTYEAKPFEQITDADWHAIIETNFMSGVRLSRHFLPKMKAAGWGRIIFISSESAVNIPVEMVHYGVTKPSAGRITRSPSLPGVQARCSSGCSRARNHNSGLSSRESSAEGLSAILSLVAEDGLVALDETVFGKAGFAGDRPRAVPSGRWSCPALRVHLDRAVGRHRDHRHPRRAVAARTGDRQAESPEHPVHQQP